MPTAFRKEFGLFVLPLVYGIQSQALPKNAIVNEAQMRARDESSFPE